MPKAIAAPSSWLKAERRHDRVKRRDLRHWRERTIKSQAAFSRRIGVSLGTFRNWEQGRCTPEGPARVLLAMLERNPRVVEETLE